MVGPDVPSEKVRVLLEDGLLAADQAIRESAETPRQYDPVFGHNWSGRHDFYTGNTGLCDSREGRYWVLGTGTCLS